MAQKRFIKYRDPITSFEANEKYTGIIEPTVYRGFDVITTRSGLDINIGHTLTGETFTQKNGTSTPSRGVWVSKQGIVVKEDGTIQVTLQTNATNNYERWDLLVAEHSYDELTVGGLPASYSVITGGNKTDPALSNPNYQVVIGRIKVPANATSSTAVVYERQRTPQLGGKFAAILKEVNRFEEQIQMAHGTTQVLTQALELAARSVIVSLPTGNTFLVNNATGFLDLLPNSPIGTEVTLIFNQDTVVRQMAAQRTTVSGTTLTAGYAAGYRPISFSSAFPTLDTKVSRGDSIKLVKTANTGATIPSNEYWAVIAVSSTIGNIEDIATRLSDLEEDVEQIDTDVSGIVNSLAQHVANVSNPHSVTKAQVGLGNLPNAKSDSTTLDDTNTLATSKAVAAAATAATNNLNAHTSNVSNPHNVTKAQVGLGTLPNVKSDSLTSNTTNSLATSKAVYDLNVKVELLAGVPSGAITMWWGTAIPAGWALCDGNNGTPNLLGRVPVGTNSGGNVGSATPIATDNNQTRTITKGAVFGSYNHKMIQTEMPPHLHLMFNNRNGQAAATNSNLTGSNYADKQTGSGGGRDEKYAIMGSTSAVGGLPVNGRTSTTGGSGSEALYHNISQPSFGIEFIMKL